MLATGKEAPLRRREKGEGVSTPSGMTRPMRAEREECGHVYGRGLTRSMHLEALKAAVGPSRIFAKIREERQNG